MAPFFLFTLLPLYSEVALLHGVEALRVVRTRPVSLSAMHGMDAMASAVSIPSADPSTLAPGVKDTQNILGRFQKLVFECWNNKIRKLGALPKDYFGN